MNNIKNCIKNILKQALHLAMIPPRILLKALDKYDMEANKIAGAIFTAGIIAMFAGLIASSIYPGGQTPHGEEVTRGYEIAGAEAFEAGADGGGEAAADEAPVDIAVYLQTADVAAGEKLIKRCTACHTFDKGGKNGVGPNNYAILSRPIAEHAGFAYSDAMLAKKGEKWNFENLSQFIESPKTFTPGTKMAFAGIRNPQDRANLLAYLNTLGSNKPYPAPKPVDDASNTPALDAVTPDTQPDKNAIPGNIEDPTARDKKLLKETDLEKPKSMQTEFNAQTKEKIKAEERQEEAEDR